MNPAVGFKEWAYVCEALTQGVCTVILRKGGIHEGRSGFQWLHRQFYLFPTWFHTQAEQLTWNPSQLQTFSPEAERESVEITGYATLEAVWKVTDWAQMQALAPYHIWTEPVVRERFIYDEESCLHVALIRAYTLETEWTFPYSKSYGGCRSWVKLPLEAPAPAAPALSDAAFQASAQAIQQILGSPNS
jgi:hypothetical protein